MNKMLKTMGLVLALLLVVGQPVAAQTQTAAIVLEDSSPVVQAWPVISVLADPQKTLGIDQILALRKNFTAPETAHDTLGLHEDAMWLRIPFSVGAKSVGFWVLDIDYPVLNRIDLFLVNDGKVVDKTTMGNLLPMDKRPVSGRAHSYGLSVKPDKAYEVYLRIENVGTMIVPITLSKPEPFFARALGEQMLQGILTGLALCLLVYSLAQWVTLGEHLFVKYAILITGSLLFSLLHFGIGAQYIWRDNVWIEFHVGGLSALIAATGSFLFIEQALAGPDMKPWLSKMMKAGAWATSLSAACYALDWITVYQVTAIVSTLGLLPSLLGLPGAIKRAQRGDSVGIYFLAAWAVYLVTTAILIEVIKGRIGANFWTMHSFQFGATFDMLLFMRVLGLRTKALQTAIQHAKIERDSMHFLAHTDALTGLPNRRSLNASISVAIQNATPEKLLAVYMLDLDGFKQVNDQFGHDVGDELLIAVADRLKSNLRSSDVISRLGGDEFLVMSSGLQNAQQAHELGQKMLTSFEDLFNLSGHAYKVGLTIGYALAPNDCIDTRQLLKLADAAMYSGKQNGKNCVKRGDSAGIL